MGFAAKFTRWLLGTTARQEAPAAPEPAVEQNGKRWRVSPSTVAELAASGPPRATWSLPAKPHWLAEAVGPDAKLAMDSVPMEAMADWAMGSNPFTEGLGFLGYGYLAELTQRSEYRRISEIWAAECTRKWIKLNGEDADRVAKLEKELVRFGVREKFREATEIDGFMGRAHIFMDFGDQDPELVDPLALQPETVPVDSLRNMKVVEAYWCYPLNFNTNNPLADDFYAPTMWQIMGKRVHNTRLLTFVGRELPDILKPVYMFGGLSMSQMAKPYVDSFIRNRTSVGNLLYSFSTMVLSTNMSAMLAPDGAGELMRRIQAFTFGRDNNGLMLVDKETEDLKNVSAPLGTVDKLLAQSQEQIASVVGIPLVVLLGVTPTGLNASSEGELKAFYAHIRGYQEKTYQAPLNTILAVLQLNMDGKLDDSITFEFQDLWELDDEAKSRIRNTDATIDQGYVDRGIIDGEEVRERLKNDPNGPYFGVDLQPGEAPDQPGQEDDEDDTEDLADAAQDAMSTLVANDALSAALAQDDGEHWITVHPNGEEPGHPLLVKNAGGGNYTVIGGAGGKLNGRTLSPKSMSKARNVPGHGGGTEKPHVDPMARREGESAGEHADRLSEHADQAGTKDAHHAAHQAHKVAAEEHYATLRLGRNAPEGAYSNFAHHQDQADKHRRAALRAEHGDDWAARGAAEATQRTLALPAKPKTAEEWAAHKTTHGDAARAHQEAYRETGLQEHYDAYRKHADQANQATKKLESIKKREATAKKREAAEAVVGEEGLARRKKLDARYQTAHPDEIDRKWTDRWGMGVFNDSSAKAKRAAAALSKDPAFRARYWSEDQEERAAARKELSDLHDQVRAGHAKSVRGHTPVDITEKSQAAKDHRAMMGHVEDALEHLESLGYNIAGALKEADVKYTPAGTRGALGHAYQRGGNFTGLGGKRTGFLSMSVGKAALDYLHDQQRTSIKSDGSRWGTYADPNGNLDHATRTVIIHELTHALGMQSHINSPDRLGKIMQKLFPDSGERHKFTHQHISRYASKDPFERDAELAAMVTRGDYKPGTLPKELEDHVAWLFNPKKGTE